MRVQGLGILHCKGSGVYYSIRGLKLGYGILLSNQQSAYGLGVYSSSIKGSCGYSYLFAPSRISLSIHPPIHPSIHLSTYSSVYLSTWIRMYVCMHAFMYACMYVSMIYTELSAYTYIYVRVCVCVCACICTCNKY